MKEKMEFLEKMSEYRHNLASEARKTYPQLLNKNFEISDWEVIYTETEPERPEETPELLK